MIFKNQIFKDDYVEEDRVESSNETDVENGIRGSYFIIESTAFIEDHGNTCTYGIGYSDGKYPQRLFSADVSTNKPYVEKIIKMLNERNVSPEHFYYILEDILP